MQVVRNAAVSALATLEPARAAKLWAGHPSVEISLGLAEIGRASRERNTIDPKTFATIDDAAAKSPLSPEPFLVHGVQAQVAGNSNEAARAFTEAQWRDPRSMPAAYFLADHYLRSGQPLEGLKQTALLARLSPRGLQSVAPFVANYAQNPANWPAMRALFRWQGTLEEGVLEALARDPGNADAILAIADAAHRKPDSRWLPLLLGSLVENGQYVRAREIWGSVGGGGTGATLITDPDFSSATAPPPFNWSLASSTVGLAERQPGKRLHVIFYGSEDGVLARQLLLLPPGTYHLQMQLAGTETHPEALSWSVRCDKADDAIATIALTDAAAHGWNFSVPADCAAQWLELTGRSGDVTQQSDVTIGRLSLRRGGPNA